MFGALYSNLAASNLVIPPNKFLWLDSSDTSTLLNTAGVVTTWKDKSGHAFDCTASGTGPTTGTQTQNGKNVTVWNGTSNFMTMNAGVYPITNSAQTMFAVGTGPVSPNGNRWWTLGVSAGQGRNDIGYNGTDSRVAYFNNNTPGSSVILSTFFTPTACNIFTAQFDGATLESIQINNGSVNSDTNGALVSNTALALLGTNTNASGTFYMGNMCEIIWYNRFLSVSEVNQVRGYLKAKWGTV